MAKVEIVVGDEASAPLGRIRRQFQRTDGVVNKSTTAVKGFSGEMYKMIGVLGSAYLGFAGIRKALDLGASFVTTTSQFEQFETTLRSITGSAQEAERSMEWIQDFGSKTPYELDKVTESFVKMKAYGLDPMDGTLTALGNASSAMGKDIVQAVEAMADAVTGENERLKEFGIKASKVGNTIAYNWADSSGEVKKVVIENNKDIIQSTLTAIFNEKYVGAMDAQSKTWSGMLSNMSDSWTIFQKDVMNEGLYDYFKGMLGVVADAMSEVFSDTSGAKTWSDTIIGGIQSTIIGFGNMFDMMNGIDLVWTTMKNGAIEFYLAVSEAQDYWEKDWDDGLVNIQNTWGQATKSIEKFWVETVNNIAEYWNEFYVDWALGFNKIADFFGSDFTLEIPQFAPTVVEEFQKIEYAQAKVSDSTKYWNEQLKESDADLKQLYSDVANEVGLKKAEEIIDKINAKVKEQKSLGGDLAKQKAEAKKALEAILKASKAQNKEDAKGSKAKEKAIKDLAKLEQTAIKDAEDGWKEVNDSISDGLNNAFSAILNGDIQGAFRNTMGSMLNMAIEYLAQVGIKIASIGVASQAQGDPYTAWARMATMATTMATLGLGVAFGGGDTQMSKEEYQDSIGVVNEPESESVVNLLESMDWAMTRELEYSKGIFDNISALVAESGRVAVALDSAFSFKGINTQEIGGFAGFSSSSIETLFTGLKLQLKDITRLSAYTEEVIRTQSESWWGLSSSTNTHTQRTALDDDMANALARAYGSGIQAIVDASGALGIDGARSIMSSFRGEMHTLDFEGKSQEEISAMIEGAISADLDILADMVVPFLGEFTKAGEGFLEAMGRISYELELVDQAFTQLGGGLSVTGERAVRVSQAFIDASGGLDQALKNTQGFIDNFYSDAEKQALRVDQLRSTGVFGDEEAYRAEVDRMRAYADQGNIWATERLADLLRLQGTYRDYFDEVTRLDNERQSLEEDRQEQAIKDIEERIAEEERLAKTIADTNADILKRITDAYSGSLSTLSNAEKASALGSLAQSQLEAGNTQGYFDTLYKQLGVDQKASSTEEEYSVKFNQYIDALSSQSADATMDTIVGKIDEVILALGEIENGQRIYT